MASYLHGIPYLDVFRLDAVVFQAVRAGRFERPQLRLSLVVLHLDVDPGVRVDQMHFLDDTLERRELRDGVVVVRMMRLDGRDEHRRDHSREHDQPDTHYVASTRIEPSWRIV